MLTHLAHLGIVLPESILTFYTTYSMLTKFIVIIGLIFVAFFGFKAFRTLLILGGSMIGAALAGTHLTSFLAPYIEAHIPEWLHIDTLIAVVAAILAALICWKLYKLVIFAGGAAVGYIFVGPIAAEWLTTAVPSFEAALASQIGIIIVSVLCALICALVLYIFFKPLFIIGTSVGGLALAGFSTVYAVVSTAPDKNILIGGVAAGAIIGIFAMIHQFKANSKVRILRF